MGSFSIILLSVLLATVIVDLATATAISEQDDAIYAGKNHPEKRQAEPRTVTPPRGCTIVADRACRIQTTIRGKNYMVQMCRMPRNGQIYTGLTAQDRRNANGRIHAFRFGQAEIGGNSARTLDQGPRSTRTKWEFRSDRQRLITHDGAQFSNIQVQINDGERRPPSPSTVAQVNIQLGMRANDRQYIGCTRAGLSESLRNGANVWIYQVTAGRRGRPGKR